MLLCERSFKRQNVWVPTRKLRVRAPSFAQALSLKETYRIRTFACQIAALPRAMPRGSPSSSKLQTIPWRAKTSAIARKLFAMGVRRPFSKSRIVESDTDAASASSFCSNANQPRAARHCSRDMIMPNDINFKEQRQRLSLTFPEVSPNTNINDQRWGWFNGRNYGQRGLYAW